MLQGLAVTLQGQEEFSQLSFFGLQRAVFICFLPILAWKIVDVAAVHQQIAVLGVAEWR